MQVNIIIRFLVLWVWLAAFNVWGGNMNSDIEIAFPSKIKGWSAIGTIKKYSRKTIFDYINGAGEIYNAYDFKTVTVQRYEKKDAPGINLEIYEMTTSGDAFGVFTYDMDGDAVDIGNQGIYAVGLLRFWKGNKYVRVFAEAEIPESKLAVMELGKGIAGQIKEEGPEPDIVNCLPSENLIKGEVRYFHTQVILSSLYYLADDNILVLGKETEAVLARYKIGKIKPRVLVVGYKDEKSALQSYNKFCGAFYKNKTEQKSEFVVEKIQESKYSGALLAARFIIIGFEFENEDSAKKTIKKVENKTGEVFK
jgi:hypothetical protein